MGRIPVTYTEEELNRPSKYIVAVCDPTVDTHIVDSEEAANYVNKWKRRAIIVSGKEVFKNSEIEKLKYLYVANSNIPCVRLIEPDGRSYKEVFKYLLGKFKNGLIIAHPETLTHEIADEFSLNKTNGLDFVVYRQDLMELSGNERGRMTHLRFHFNSEFSFTKELFTNYTEKFGTHGAIGIFTCQYIANYQYNQCQDYIKENTEMFEQENATDYVDYYAMNKQVAYHVYYDLHANKIIGLTTEKIKFYMEQMFTAIDHKPLYNKAGEFSTIYTA